VALIQTGQRDEALREIDTLLKMPLEGGIAAKARELRRELARQSK
jgi:hypothetical protein